MLRQPIWSWCNISSNARGYYTRCLLTLAHILPIFHNFTFIIKQKRTTNSTANQLVAINTHTIHDDTTTKNSQVLPALKRTYHIHHRLQINLLAWLLASWQTNANDQNCQIIMRKIISNYKLNAFSQNVH